MLKKYYRIIINTAFVGCLVSLIFFVCSCRCDDKVYIAVMAGVQDEKACANLAEMALNNQLPDVTFACPGEKVTICWGGNVKNNKIDPLGMRGQGGAEQIVVDHSMTVRIEPQGSCASAKEFKIIVLEGETPSTWQGRWAPDETGKKCGYVMFKISPYFMSPNIKVTKVTAQFKETEATGSPCHVPPFLTGLNTASLPLFGFTINKPFDPVPITMPVSAVGDWKFDFIDPGCKRDCKPDASLPFELVLKCPDKP